MYRYGTSKIVVKREREGRRFLDNCALARERVIVHSKESYSYKLQLPVLSLSSFERWPVVWLVSRNAFVATHFVPLPWWEFLPQ
jgi:hypothetical protein